MKKIFFLMISGMLSIHVIAQGVGGGVLWEKYCAKLVDGKIIVMTEGVELISDVTLDNGTRIKPDGTVTKPDGSKIILKDGECIDLEGKMLEPKVEEK